MKTNKFTLTLPEGKSVFEEITIRNGGVIYYQDNSVIDRQYYLERLNDYIKTLEVNE